MSENYLDSGGGVVFERLCLSIFQEYFQYVRHERNHGVHAINGRLKGKKLKLIPLKIFYFYLMINNK